MNWQSIRATSPRNQLQTRLIILVVVFMFLCCVVLTFAPAIRIQSLHADLKWQHWVGFVVWLGGFSLLFHQFNRYLPDRDPFLLPILSLLTGWGLLVIFRLTPYFGFRQTAWLAVCIAGMLLALRIPNLLQFLRRYKYIWLTLGLLLTLLTFLFGTYPGGGGPQLWLGIGGIYVQPSEVLKTLLVIYLAAYLADSLPARFKLLQLLMPTLVIIGLAVLIVVAQRDLGTASLFIFLYTIIVYLASGKRRVLLISFLLILAAFIAGYLVFDVIRLRVEAWLNPWLDPRAGSYQIIQSIIAVANGGLLGRGIGLGSPGVIPVAHSDFIFPAILEEFGLVGGIGLVSLYILFCIRGLTIALHAPNQFQRLLAGGLTAYISTQAILIMGGTIRLLPLTGVTLPFVSYGGTSLVMSFFAFLLLLLISNQAEVSPAPIENSRPYLLIGSVFLAGFVAVCAVTAWWSVVRADTLLERSDNPRRAISDQFVYRGTIYDKNTIPLAEDTGPAGSYERTLHYPNLSAVIGYSNPNYGQTGIEYAEDGYLRGLDGNIYKNILLAGTLYGQYPPGFDIRLSIDLPLQTLADETLAGKTGAVILMNAESGEILAMSTSPTFDAGQLEAKWETWMQDKTAPLLNRATQALYPPGTTVSGLFLARILNTTTIPAAIPQKDWNSDPGSAQFCAIPPEEVTTWGKLISSGCIGPVTSLSQTLIKDQAFTLLKQSGLFTEPAFPLETSQPVVPSQLTSYTDLYIGKINLLVSPLQVVTMASLLSNGGKVTSPRIAMTYKSLSGYWEFIEQKTSGVQIKNLNISDAATRLTQGNFPGWELSSYAEHDKAKVAWFVAGTPPDWYSTPLTLVVALEDADPATAREIGRRVFLAAISSEKK